MPFRIENKLEKKYNFSYDYLESSLINESFGWNKKEFFFNTFRNTRYVRQYYEEVRI